MNGIADSAFARVIRTMFGANGDQWLATLPDRITRAEQAWQVQVGPPIAGLSFNYVAPATRYDGTACMFKACFPGKENDMLWREIAALQAYHGRGMCALLASDTIEGTLLLERLQPGTQLASLDDDERATYIAADVIRELLRPAPETIGLFVTAQDRADQLGDLRTEFGGNTGPYPHHLVDMAESLFRDLIASSGPPMLIHADLHHYNILADGDAWRAIDPQGVIAEAEFECGALLRNPHALANVVNLDKLSERRVAILAESLGFDRQRVAAWGIAQAVLSAWWTYEDTGKVDDNWLPVADSLARLVR